MAWLLNSRLLSLPDEISSLSILEGKLRKLGWLRRVCFTFQINELDFVLRPRVVGLTASPGQGDSGQALDKSLADLVAEFPQRTRILRPTISFDLAKQEWKQVRDSAEQEKLLEVVMAQVRSSCQGLGLPADILSSTDRALRHVGQIKEALFKATDLPGIKLRDRVLLLISALQMIKSFGPLAAWKVLDGTGVIPEGSDPCQVVLTLVKS